MVEKGGNAEVDTTSLGYTAAAGENTIYLNNLTADARVSCPSLLTASLLL